LTSVRESVSIEMRGVGSQTKGLDPKLNEAAQIINEGQSYEGAEIYEAPLFLAFANDFTQFF